LRAQQLTGKDDEHKAYSLHPSRGTHKLLHKIPKPDLIEMGGTRPYTGSAISQNQFPRRQPLMRTLPFRPPENPANAFKFLNATA
jgi:hypothetical protein